MPQGAAHPARLPRPRAASGGRRGLLAEQLAGRVLALDAGSLGEVARTRGARAARADAEGRRPAIRGSLLHARSDRARTATLRRPERGPRGARPLRRRGPRAAGAAGPLLGRRDRQRHRLRARAADRPRADAGLRARVAARSCPATRAGCSTRRPSTSRRAATSTASGGSRAATVALLVGDVAGKGVETAALSAMVRFFIEARSWDEPRSGRGAGTGQRRCCVGRLPRDSFVTAFLGVLSRGSLRYANAGHLAASADPGPRGRAPRVAGLPLGVDPVDRYGESELALEHGELAVRVHGRADRGAPLGRDLRPRPADRGSWPAAPRRWAPAELVRTVHDEIADGRAEWPTTPWRSRSPQARRARPYGPLKWP